MSTMDGHLAAARLAACECGLGDDVATIVAATEHRFRVLAEAASDVVFETDAASMILWVSPSVHHVLGWRPEEWLGRLACDLIAPEDVAAASATCEAALRGGRVTEPLEARFMAAGGEHRWMSVQPRHISPDGAQPSGLIVGLRDVQREVVLRRAGNTLSAGNAALVRAEREEQLLYDMCELAVEQGGYLFAWYGRAIDDEARSVRPVAWSQKERDYLDTVRISWGDGPLGQGPTGTCIRTGHARIVDDFLLDSSYLPWVDAATARGFRSSVSLPVVVDGAVDGALMVYAAEVGAFDERSLAALVDLASQLGYGLGRLRDQQRLAAALDEQRLLSTAIDQAAEAVVVTDTTPVIRYANPAALRVSGYEASEVIGQSPSMFQSGLHDSVFYEQMWSRLVGGQSWHGVLMNRRKNGELFEEDATITPVHDAAGARIAYVAVKHDLSRERILEAAVSRDRIDRDAVIEVMRTVRPSESLEGTAGQLCEAVQRFADVDGVMLIVLGVDGTAVPVAAVGPIPPSMRVGTPLAMQKLDLLVLLSRAGPWWLDLLDSAVLAGLDPVFTDAMTSVGFTAAGYAPLRSEGDVIGALAVASRSPTARDWMPGRLGMLAELGSFAGMLLGPQAIQRSRAEAMRSVVAETIRERRFRTVFEPVVNLVTGEAVGFEALTRFDDDVAPDQRFSDAQLVGLGSELEAACASAALRAAADLPDGVWVSVNFSPTTIVDGHAASVVAGAVRPVVIEITEHNAIENYAAVRRAIAGCGDVRVAVDDAGAGFASLRHILELRPDIIKLDLALVRDIDSDPAKQALAAGLRHFAALTGTTLIAEGVETDAQAHVVRVLGVEFAQGFLFRHTST